MTASKYGPILHSAVAAVQEAGEALRQEFHQQGGPEGTGGHAEIDERIEEQLRDRFRQLTPSFRIVGEELGSDFPDDPDSEQHCWVIDPNDGTRFYLSGFRGSSVSVALLRGGVPVLGVVYAYGAPTDHGDLFAWAEGETFERNGQPVQRAAWAKQLTPAHTVLVSQNADYHSTEFAAGTAPARFRACTSIAWRLALAAAGEGEAALSLSGPVAWDYAAGHALLKAVGGDLYNSQGEPITYTMLGHSSSGGVCAGGGPTARQLAQANWDGVFGARQRSTTSYDLVRPQRGDAIADVGLLDRAQGCLLGQLAGDSLGGLVEFETAAAIAARYPDKVTELADGGCWGNLAGQATDDSELALLLARTLVEVEQFDEDAIAAAYAFWFRSGPFDIGNTTRQALAAANKANNQGDSPAAASRAAASQSSQANGALMRISPLALFGHAAPPHELVAWAQADALLTHPHLVCQHASAVFVLAIQRALVTGDSPRELYDYTLAWAESSDIHADVLASLEQASSGRPAEYQQQMGWVRIALQNAFYQLLHAETAAEGIIDTVMQGGDTDTNGAIAGALLGAAHGASTLPSQWVDRLLTCRPLPKITPTKHPRPRAFWPVDALFLAERLLTAR
ncbi:inositol monophosphatase family protein [Lignipirellula cremea]|uniref:ADP-ribosyl-[dinitrogen reductase] glycohydrolase n=1 Tax=Lignipirellula cremea TaxID=2528010 RepID=A0A518E2E9_9BACT|nr:inositol monophosphatase family protein [Lignipirellula cremea]QDU98244.1 ADP-ribosyl-[dinitrogen reductase] glycohydrolase [Lignipirellula cremea]